MQQRPPQTQLHSQSNALIPVLQRQWIAQRADALRAQYPSPCGAAMDCVWLLMQMQQADVFPRLRLSKMQGLYTKMKVEALSVFDKEQRIYHILMDTHRLQYPFQTSRQRRSNFTLAHELGHILLGHTDLPDQLVNPQLRRRYEMQADEFAGCLLMPQWLLLGCQMQDTAQVAAFFQVSEAALWQRLNNLGRLDLLQASQRRRPCCSVCGNLRFNLWQSRYCAVCANPVSQTADGVLPMHYDAHGQAQANACSQCARVLPGFARFCDQCAAPTTWMQAGELRPWQLVLQQTDSPLLPAIETPVTWAKYCSKTTQNVD